MIPTGAAARVRGGPPLISTQQGRVPIYGHSADPSTGKISFEIRRRLRPFTANISIAYGIVRSTIPAKEKGPMPGTLVISRHLPQEALELARAGATVRLPPDDRRLTPDELADYVGDAEALVCL